MTEVAEGSDSVELRPLLRRDPPAVGDIRLIGRIGDHDAGMTYVGRLMLDDTPSEPAPDGDDTDTDTDAGEADETDVSAPPDITVVMLTAGAEADSYARARFRQAIDDLDHDRPTLIVGREEENDLAPWVALTAASRAEGLAISERLLKAVTLEDQTPVGTVHGPEFRPHWWERRRGRPLASVAAAVAFVAVVGEPLDVPGQLCRDLCAGRARAVDRGPGVPSPAASDARSGPRSRPQPAVDLADPVPVASEPRTVAEPERTHRTDHPADRLTARTTRCMAFNIHTCIGNAMHSR